MLKYLIIPLSGNAVSFCHYNSQERPNDFIPVETLRNAIFWAMKENLSVQFVYPASDVPDEILAAIDTVDHIDIVPSDMSDAELRTQADIVVFDDWNDIDRYEFSDGKAYVVRTSLAAFIGNVQTVKSVLPKLDRLNVVLTDIPGMSDMQIDSYKESLESLIPAVAKEYVAGHPVQLNVLTDRMVLDGMNNCNAGDESITLASDGNFYICPAFSDKPENAVGNIQTGLDVRNPQLYKLTHAPICRICDAYQCKRCVWLNKILTREVNTPGREQCVLAHVERNASKKLLEELRKLAPGYLEDKKIEEVGYLDPFEKLIQTQ